MVRKPLNLDYRRALREGSERGGRREFHVVCPRSLPNERFTDHPLYILHRTACRSPDCQADADEMTGAYGSFVLVQRMWNARRVGGTPPSENRVTNLRGGSDNASRKVFRRSQKISPTGAVRLRPSEFQSTRLLDVSSI